MCMHISSSLPWHKVWLHPSLLHSLPPLLLVHSLFSVPSLYGLFLNECFLLFVPHLWISRRFVLCLLPSVSSSDAKEQTAQTESLCTGPSFSCSLSVTLSLSLPISFSPSLSRSPSLSLSLSPSLSLYLYRLLPLLPPLSLSPSFSVSHSVSGFPPPSFSADRAFERGRRRGGALSSYSVPVSPFSRLPPPPYIVPSPFICTTLHLPSIISSSLSLLTSVFPSWLSLWRNIR